MAWLHCSTKDGSCVAVTEDANFDPNNVSEAMELDFVHVHVDELLEDVRHLTETILGPGGEVDDDGHVHAQPLIHKFRGKIDLADPSVIPVGVQEDVKNPRRRVRPLKKIIPLSKIADRGK